MAIETNLVSYWPLVSTSNDTYGTNNGTDTNISYASGSAESDATGNRIDLGTPAGLNFGTGNFTVAGWAYFDSIPASGSGWIVLAKGLTSLDTPQYRGFWLSAFNGTMSFWTGGGGSYTQCGTVAASTGQWYHMVGVRSGTTTTLYVNGVAAATATSGSVYDVTNPYVGTMLSAYNGSWYDTYSDGKINDVASWARDLSAAEVAAIHTAGRGNLATLLPALGAVVPDITGAPGAPATFDGSASTSVAYYRWSWPYGLGIPFPDNGAVTPIDMTDNEGLWHFEGNANDTSGNARNGTVTGASLVTGKVGSQAYQFGAADYISFGAASTFISANFSISFWLKGDAAWTPAVYDSIMGASNAFSWSQGFGIYWGGATTICCFVGGYGTFASVSVVPADWNNIVMTYDGSNIKAYLNGSLISTTAHSAALTGLTNDFYASWLGTHGGGEQTIDELAIWSRAISASEVSGIYTAQNIGPLLVPSGSAVDNAPIPFPDNGATTPLNMTDNEGLWHFDSASTDTSGEGNNATLSGTTYVTGKVGTHAVDFSSGDYVEVPNDASLNSATGTVSFWIKTSTSTAGSHASLISKNDSSSSRDGWHIFLNNNQITAQIKNNFATTSWPPPTGAALNDGAWHHLVLVFVSGNPSYIYLDGTLNSTSSWPWITYTVTTTNPMRMGVNVDGWWGNYVGAMDEVALWSRALSAAEVADIYAAQSGALAGIGTPTFTFTPDLVGTYTVNLEVNATTNANADCVVTLPAAGGGGDPSQGASSQGGGLQGSGVDLQGYT